MFYRVLPHPGNLEGDGACALGLGCHLSLHKVCTSLIAAVEGESAAYTQLTQSGAAQLKTKLASLLMATVWQEPLQGLADDMPTHTSTNCTTAIMQAQCL